MIKENCANDWWDNKLNYSTRINMIEKYFPQLFHINKDIIKTVTQEMIIQMYNDSTKN